MKKVKTTAANRSNAQPEGLLEFVDAMINGVSVNPNEDVMKSVFFNDLRGECRPDGFATGLLEDMRPDWLSERVFCQTKDALRGLTEGMALEVADDVVDCWCYGVCHFVGIQYIDRMLNSLYNKILWEASRQGVVLPMHF